MKFQKLHLNILVDRVIIGPTNPDNPGVSGGSYSNGY